MNHQRRHDHPEGVDIHPCILEFDKYRKQKARKARIKAFLGKFFGGLALVGVIASFLSFNSN